MGQHKPPIYRQWADSPSVLSNCSISSLIQQIESNEEESQTLRAICPLWTVHKYKIRKHISVYVCPKKISTPPSPALISLDM